MQTTSTLPLYNKQKDGSQFSKISRENDFDDAEEQTALNNISQIISNKSESDLQKEADALSSKERFEIEASYLGISWPEQVKLKLSNLNVFSIY